MDPRLFSRYLEGDEDAAHTMESELRRFAGKMLGFSAFGIDDPTTINVLAVAAASEAMERGGRDLDSFLAGTVLAAGRRGLEHRRKKSPPQTSARHIPPGVLVSAALVPNAMAGPALTAVEQHLAVCKSCKEEMELVRDATSSATAPTARSETPSPPAGRSPEAGRSYEVEHSPEVGHSSEGDRSAAAGRSSPAAALSPQAVDPDIQELLKRSVREAVAEQNNAARAGSPEATGRVGRVMDPRRASRARKKKSLPWGLVISISLVAMLLFRFGRDCEIDRQPAVRCPEIAALASLLPPPLPDDPGALPEARDALQDLSQGNCDMAANRFRSARRRHPDNWLLWYYEGACFVCVGSAPDAREALDQAASMVEDPSEELRWALLQAALLDGDFTLAQTLVFDLEVGSSSYRDAASELARRLKAMQP